MPEDQNDKPYTNREIREKWHDTANNLQDIKSQTRITNGRVTALERWQFIFMGGLGTLTFIVVPLLAWALLTLSNINETVHKSVDDALQAYNIKK